MKVISTRNSNASADLSQAIMRGLADDGGLYIPTEFPAVNMNDFSVDDSYAEFAEKVLDYFFHDEPLADTLGEITARAFDFDVPLKKLSDDTFILELHHGPTSSFKDFGARFLAECMQALNIDNKKTTILVATSGDTGSAVASAFHKKACANVIVLFPKGKITERQQQQITGFGDNVLALAVKGTFDDCQHLVKQAQQECNKLNLSTANSINLGRLLPQVVFHAYTAWHFEQQHGCQAGFIVPSGNVGNVTACYWAKRLGFPIREIAIATNSNRVLSDYLEKAEFIPRSSIETHASAMDVGNPSNFERLQALFADHNEFKRHVQVMSVTDAEIEATIVDVYQKYNELICPHTATAFFMRKHLSDKAWVIVATAEAAKFETVIEPLVKQKIPLSKRLLSLLHNESEVLEVSADFEALIEIMETMSVE